MVRKRRRTRAGVARPGRGVVVGDLLADLDSMHRAIACETMYFGMSISGCLSGRGSQCRGGGYHAGVHQYVTDDGLK